MEYSSFVKRLPEYIVVIHVRIIITKPRKAFNDKAQECKSKLSLNNENAI